MAVRPSTTEAAGAAATAAAIAEAVEQPLDRPAAGSPGVFRLVGKWAGKLVSKTKRDGDGGVDDGFGDRAAARRVESRPGDRERGGEKPGDREGAGGRMGRREEGRRGERNFEATESGGGAGFGMGEVYNSEGTARLSAKAAGEGEDFSLLFPFAAPPSLAPGASGSADDASKFLSAPGDDIRGDDTGGGAAAPGEDGGGTGGGADDTARFAPVHSGGGVGRVPGGVDCFGNGGAVVVFQLLMQRWRLRPWVVVPRTLVATKEQVRGTYSIVFLGGGHGRERKCPLF